MLFVFTECNFVAFLIYPNLKTAAEASTTNF